VYDGAIPSGNSVAMWNLLRLGRMTGEVRLEEKAAALSRAFSTQVTPRASAFTLLMCAVDFAQGGFEVVIAGDPEKGDTRAMLSALRKLYLPNKVVLLRPGSEKNPAISELAAYTKFQFSMDGKATAYVCRNYVCSAPTTEVEKMLALLAKKE
ncbi:MAG: thioredoxin domain-containing protein, partial [Planctomycetes bacterium]|nr:thioredoxin domain-containing protein [Planctomycetota bacterium]